MLSQFDPPLSVEEVVPIFPELDDLCCLKPGAEGAVFKCYHRILKKDVLLKIYGPFRQIRRTELEIAKLQAIKSPYIVSLLDSGKKEVRGGQCHYLLLDFIHGENLADILKSGRKLTSEQVKDLLLNGSSAVQSLWDASVVHCDIKPDNIMLSSSGQFILIDLGVAKHLDVETITAVTILCYGTNGYLAPEQFEGRKNLTLRADLYALAITAWQAVTGTHPFGYNQGLMKIAELPALPKGIVLDTEVAAILYKMARRRAYQRPVSYFEIENQLRGAGK